MGRVHGADIDGLPDDAPLEDALRDVSLKYAEHREQRLRSLLDRGVNILHLEEEENGCVYAVGFDRATLEPVRERIAARTGIRIIRLENGYQLQLYENLSGQETPMSDQIAGMAPIEDPWQYMERLALEGALRDRNIDKSDWIRIWAVAREGQGKPTESTDWRDAFAEAARMRRCAR